MTNKISTHMLAVVDCDDTLILWNVSEYPDLPKVTIQGDVLSAEVAVHIKNINTITKFIKLGYKIVVWSQTGPDWAEKVAKAVGLHPYVSLYMAKPRYYFDDLPCQEWMGTRLYRDPKTGIPEKD